MMGRIGARAATAARALSLRLSAGMLVSVTELAAQVGPEGCTAMRITGEYHCGTT